MRKKKVYFIDCEVEVAFASTGYMPGLFYDWEVLNMAEVAGRDKLEALLTFPDGNLTARSEIYDRASDLCAWVSEAFDGYPGLLIVQGSLPQRFWDALRKTGDFYGLEVLCLVAYGIENVDGQLKDYVELDDELEKND